MSSAASIKPRRCGRRGPDPTRWSKADHRALSDKMAVWAQENGQPGRARLANGMGWARLRGMLARAALTGERLQLTHADVCRLKSYLDGERRREERRRGFQASKKGKKQA